MILTCVTFVSVKLQCVVKELVLTLQAKCRHAFPCGLQKPIFQVFFSHGCVHLICI